jgi:hypothetical protein
VQSRLPRLVVAMVCSAVFIMDLKGKILISRNYRGDIPMSVSEKFTKHLYVDRRHADAATRPLQSDGRHIAAPCTMHDRSLLHRMCTLSCLASVWRMMRIN